MKKIFIVCLTIVILVLIAFNPSERSLKSYISSSSDNDLFLPQQMQTAKPIVLAPGHFFGPFCKVSRINCLLFSVYTIEYGWFGNLRIDGSDIDRSRIIGTGQLYSCIGTMRCFSILNNHIKLNNSFEKNWR